MMNTLLKTCCLLICTTFSSALSSCERAVAYDDAKHGSLSPRISEWLLHIKPDLQLVAVAQYDLTQSDKTITVGNFQQVDLEAMRESAAGIWWVEANEVQALCPVFMQEQHSQELELYCYPCPNSIADITDVAKEISTKLNVPHAQWLPEWQASLQPRELSGDLRVLLMLTADSLGVIERQQVLSEVLGLAGAENALADISNGYRQLDMEQLRLLNPDAILLLQSSLAGVPAYLLDLPYPVIAVSHPSMFAHGPELGELIACMHEALLPLVKSP